MSPGLKLIQISITNYRAITIVGWLRRVAGDEYELVPGARIISRKPTEMWDWNGIDTLAAKGPGKKYDVHPAMEQPEPVHRLMVRRCKPANESAWIEYCPRPSDSVLLYGGPA